MSDYRLKVFVAVAKNLSFTKAAAELYITQPAVSNHIKELEEQYGVRLFERSSTTMSLTPAGELFLSHAVEILDKYGFLEFEMNQLSRKFSGELKIGASTTIGQYVLPSLLALFFRRYPDVKLTLIDGNSQSIEAALLGNSIDIGIVEGLHSNSSLRYSDFLDDEIVLVADSRGKYGSLEEVTLEQLSAFPLVLREHGSGTLEVIEGALSSAGLSVSSLNVILNLGSTESIKEFILHTDSLAFLSIRSIFRELKGDVLKVIEIPSLSFNRKFRFASRFGPLLPLAEHFVNFAIENAE